MCSYHLLYTQRVCPCRDNGTCTTRFGSFALSRIETWCVLSHLILDRPQPDLSPSPTPPSSPAPPPPKRQVYVECARQWDTTGHNCSSNWSLPLPVVSQTTSSSKNYQQTNRPHTLTLTLLNRDAYKIQYTDTTGTQGGVQNYTRIHTRLHLYCMIRQLANKQTNLPQHWPLPLPMPIKKLLVQAQAIYSIHAKGKA